MKIEISKKQLIIALTTIAVIAFRFTGGCFLGFYKEVESTENPKGGGAGFYMEYCDDSQKGSKENLLLYNSTLDL